MGRQKKQFRLFFSIQFSMQTQLQLSAWQSTLPVLGGRKISADNFHLTLLFIGDSSQRDLETLLDKIESPKLDPFSLVANQMLFWPRQGIVALAAEPVDKLNALHLALRKQVASMIPVSKAKNNYSPHITLYRGSEFASAASNPAAIESPVKEFHLMESQLSQNGASYRSLAHWPLAGPSVKELLLGSNSGPQS